MFCSPHCCAIFSFTGVLFLLFVYVLLLTQPFYVIQGGGVDEVDRAKTNALGAMGLYAVLFLISMALIGLSRRGESNATRDGSLIRSGGNGEGRGYVLLRDMTPPHSPSWCRLQLQDSLRTTQHARRLKTKSRHILSYLEVFNLDGYSQSWTNICQVRCDEVAMLSCPYLPKLCSSEITTRRWICFGAETASSESWVEE